MSATGSMARECSKFYSRLSEMIAEKRDQPYSVIHCRYAEKFLFLLSGVLACASEQADQ